MSKGFALFIIILWVFIGMAFSFVSGLYVCEQHHRRQADRCVAPLTWSDDAHTYE